MRLRLPLALAAGTILTLAAVDAKARHCGGDDCGEHGACRDSSLIAKCDCDDGYASVLTYLDDGSQGAYCVPLPAAPELCEGLDCGPHGVCATDGDAGPHCRCDPGFVEEVGRCVDDVGDDAERACDGVTCGDGGTCMATADAITCRCAPGDLALLGRAGDGGFGPVCATPANPETACGPDACGPYGECVLSQAAFCRCEPGASVEELRGSDGRLHPFCVDPDRPPPDAGAPHDASAPHDGGASDDAGETSDAGATLDAGSLTPPPSEGGCSCRTTEGGTQGHGSMALLGSLLTAATLHRRNKRIQTTPPK